MRSLDEASAAPVATKPRPWRHLSTPTLWTLLIDAEFTRKMKIAAQCQEELNLRREAKQPSETSHHQTIFQLRGSASSDRAALERLANYVRKQFDFAPLRPDEAERLILTARGGDWADAAGPLRLDLLKRNSVIEILRLCLPFRIQTRFVDFSPQNEVTP